MRTILLDIGGTFIKCADGRRIPSHSDGTAEEIACALREAVEMPGRDHPNNLQFSGAPIAGHDGRDGHDWHDGAVTPDPIGGPCATGGPEAVGIAIPGPFDFGQGRFLMRHKFAAVYGQDFRTLAGLPDEVELRCRHDVAAQLDGAIRMLGLEDENVALVTLGTGLGFAHAIKGEVQCGPTGSPARGLWNLPLAEGGILEDRVSARGISSAYAALSGGQGLNPLAISLLARKGDAAALEAYRQTGAQLGAALKDLLPELGVRTLLLGGQIAGSADLLLESLQEAAGNGIRILRAPEGAVFEGLKCLFT